MTKFLATPLAMTQDFFRTNAGYGEVGTPQDYVERQTIEVEAQSLRFAAEETWKVFQNIDENRLCPDGGRSLMVGDIIRLRNCDDETETLMRVASFGFEEIRSLKTIFPRAVEAMQNPDLTYEDIVADDD